MAYLPIWQKKLCSQFLDLPGLYNFTLYIYFLLKAFRCPNLPQEGLLNIASLWGEIRYIGKADIIIPPSTKETEGQGG